MKPEKTQLISDVVIGIFRTNGRMLEWGDSFTAPFGITSARWQILGAIALGSQRLTAPQIAEQMGISRQGAQKQLNLLTADGLIERLANPTHQRSPHYQLSRLGDVLFQQVNAAWASHAREVGQHFSRSELKTAIRVLNALTNIHTAPCQGENDEA